MRHAFIEELIFAAKKNKKIMLIVNDLGYGVIEKFAKLYPKQFINAGVAEQNMMGLAAGLAMEKNHVFVYSIGNFPTFRCAEQIRNDVDYHNLSVSIVNVGSGVTYGNLGYSHHSLQDYSLMRCMPNILISSPCNDTEVKNTLRYLINKPQPSYLRLGKNGTQDFLNFKSTNKIKPGVWSLIKKGKNDRAILLTGNTTSIASDLIKQKKYQYYSIYSLPLWGMKYKKIQLKQAKKLKNLLTIEDHFYDGGFGSWLNESFNEFGLKLDLSSLFFNTDVIGKVGSEKFLTKRYLKKI